MQEIIVLGRVPGTELQLDFLTWLYIVLGLLLLALVHLTWRELSARLFIKRADTHATRIFHTMQHYRQY